MSDQLSPSAAIGARLDAIREAAGLRQSDVEATARAYGLAWPRTTFSAYKKGRRTLELTEAAVLVVALRSEHQLDVTLEDLLPDDAWIETGNGQGRWHGAALRAVLRGEPDEVTPAQADVPRWRAAKKAVADGAVERALKGAGGHITAMVEVWPDATAGQLAKAEMAAHGEAERNIARRWDVTPFVVSAAAFRLWGRSLTDERDARAADAAGADATDAQLQAVRGHVTRGLVDDLRPVLTPDE